MSLPHLTVFSSICEEFRKSVWEVPQQADSDKQIKKTYCKGQKSLVCVLVGGCVGVGSMVANAQQTCDCHGDKFTLPLLTGYANLCKIA